MASLYLQTAKSHDRVLQRFLPQNALISTKGCEHSCNLLLKKSVHQQDRKFIFHSEVLLGLKQTSHQSLGGLKKKKQQKKATLSISKNGSICYFAFMVFTLHWRGGVSKGIIFQLSTAIFLLQNVTVLSVNTSPTRCCN